MERSETRQRPSLKLTIICVRVIISTLLLILLTRASLWLKRYAIRTIQPGTGDFLEVGTSDSEWAVDAQIARGMSKVVAKLQVSHVVRSR